jgi:tetratricopeptide (TPR) repeat protein
VSRNVAEKTFDAATKAHLGDDALNWAEVMGNLVGETGRSLGMRARALAELGRSDEALVFYERSLALEADDPWVLNNFSVFLLSPGGGIAPDPRRALELARKAVDLANPPDAANLETLARAYWDLGEPQRAVEVERRALALAPTDPGLQRTLERYERGVRAPR